MSDTCTRPNCTVCRDAKYMNRLKAILTGDDWEYAEDLYLRAVHAEMDVCYYKSRLEGTWPTPDALEEPAK